MGFFIQPDGSYYEGDRAHALDVEVPQRPSQYHSWGGKQWAADPRVLRNTPIDAQIAAVEEANLAPRFAREGLMNTALAIYVMSHPGATAAAALAALTSPADPSFNVGFARLKALDDSIVALRAQRLP